VGGRKKQPFSVPHGSWQLVTGYTLDAVRGTWKEMAGGGGGALKMAEVARGQVRAGDAVTDASYDH
jgi:hypothetical protein